MRAAIKDGRLSASLTPDRKRIADAAAADAELDATTNVDMAPASGPTAPKAQAAPSPLAEHRARQAAAAATLAELELDEKRGQLVRIEDVEARWADIVTILRTKLLGIQARARLRDPSLTTLQLRLFDILIREALEELAVEAEA